MLKKIGALVALLLLGLVLAIGFQPTSFRIARSRVIRAPAEVVFGLLSDFHVWDAWSPWSKLDPGMTKTYSGAERGKGSVYAWSGNDQVGEGRMEIVDLSPNRQVTIDLQFIAPFEARNTTVFTLAERPAAGGVEVVWEMRGKNDFLGKAFDLFMDMDALVGRDFERGLTQLAQLAEAGTRAPASPSRP